MSEKNIKGVFLEIYEDWESYWKDEIEFYDFLTDFVEINDDKKKTKIEAEG